MLAAILEWSLRNRALVVGGWVAIVLSGVAAFVDLPLDAFPDTTPVQVQVNAVAPALGPVDLERRVTIPIERAVSGVPDLAGMRSVSSSGFAQVTLTFEDGTDVWLARQAVSERIAGLSLDALDAPASLGPVATGLGEIFHYLVRGRGVSLAELRTIQEYLVAPQLRAVPGVAEVNTWGGDERRIEVVVDPRALIGYELGVSELAAAIEAAQGSAGGGVLESGGQSTLVRGDALAERPEDVAEMVVAHRDGVPVRVRDVAPVRYGRAVRRGAVSADARGETVLGLGFLRMGENSRIVTEALRARLTEVAPTLPPGVEVEVVYARTTLVDQVLRTAGTNLLEGALLVVVVLFVFLGDLRSGALVALAIPLSLLFAGNLMWTFGIAGTLMSLGAIDFGLVVDSAVIQVENATKRLAEAAPGAARLEVIRDAVLEVRRPTMFGELILAIVYLPILALTGYEGQLFRPMALTVVFALAGSMALSLTLIPALATWVLPHRPRHREPWIVRLAKRAYAPVLAAALRWREPTLAAALGVVVAGALIAAQLGAEFVPRLGEGTIVANTIRMAGVTVDESVRVSTRMERTLLDSFPDEIERVWSRTGTAEIATDPMGIELSDVFITLRPREAWTRARTQEDLVTQMAQVLEVFPGTRVVFTQPIEMRMNEMIAGVRADVGVLISGEDLETLRRKAGEVERVLSQIEGAADVSVEPMTGQSALTVEIDRAALARHGVAARDVLIAVEALAGHQVGVAYEGEIPIPIALVIDRERVGDVEAVGALPIPTSSGDRVPLRRVATLRVEDAPSAVRREWGRRRALVQANVRGRDLAGFVDEARAAIDERVALPAGYGVRFTGQFEHLERARARLAIVVPVALGSILVLLYVTYRRMRDALRVFLGVPVAMAGGVFALAVRGMPFSISAAVGFIALSGVAVLGDMVLVSTIRALEADGRAPEDAVREAARERLRPVLMTALVAALGFVPMALSTGVGAEVQRPLATVVIGGLVTSTLTTLVVLPVLYAIGRKRA